MEKFTASNGVVVWLPDSGKGLNVSGDAVDLDRLRERLAGPARGDVLPAAAEALREYFRAEEDERLGRWRWRENPDYVVYPSDNGCTIVRESDGDRSSWNRGWIADDTFAKNRHYPAARAYFDAHPLRKPWHDAEPGEVWVLDVDAETVVCGVTRTGPDFEPVGGHQHWVTITRGYEGIRGGRRIWPEGD